MRCKLLFVKAFAALAIAQLCALSHPMLGQTSHAFVHERDVNGRFPPGVDTPRWSGRSLLGYELDMTAAPILYSVDRNGNREEYVLTLPGVSMVSIGAMAGGADGAIAVSGGIYSSDAQIATFFVWISPDRKTQIVTRIWPYVATKIAIAADGTIWTAGFLKNDENTKVVVYNQLRHFETSGKQLAAFMVRTRQSKQLLSNGTTYSWLGASSDRVGWLSNGNEYIEFSLDGTEMQRFDGPADLAEAPGSLAGAGLSADNEIALGVRTKAGLKVFTLDRKSRTWNALLPEEKASHWVGGFDGGTLITLPEVEPGGVMRRYTRKDVPAGPQSRADGAGRR
jgi:hypothetical protein